MGSKTKTVHVGLALAGVNAFIFYVLAFEFKIGKLSPDAEITMFTTVIQAIGYLIMMGIANILYNLGRVAERVIQPTDIDSFRNKLFTLGFWLSIAVPFSIPVFVLFNLTAP